MAERCFESSNHNYNFTLLTTSHVIFNVKKIKIKFCEEKYLGKKRQSSLQRRELSTVSLDKSHSSLFCHLSNG